MAHSQSVERELARLRECEARARQEADELNAIFQRAPVGDT